MTKLSGSVNALTPDELQKERQRYEEMGWSFPDGLTHRVRIQVPISQIDEFCAALKALQQDRKGIYQQNRQTGERSEIPSVSFYMNGSEMTGTWIKLWGRVGGNRLAPSPSQQHDAASEQRTAARQATRQAPAPKNDSGLFDLLSSNTADDEEIPF
jgi:hypothetical protein